MSTDTVTAAIEAPVAAVPDAAPEPVEQAGSRTASEARQKITDMRMGRTVAEQVNERPAQARDDSGRFTNPAAADDAPAPDSAPPAEPVAEAATTEAAAAPSQDRIPIPDNHPLRARGRQYADELTPDELRGLLNTPIKRAEIEQLQQQSRSAEQARLRAEKEVQALREQLSSAWQRPEVAERYQQIKDAWGEEEAARYLRGVEAEQQQAVQARVEEADVEYAQMEAERQGQEFVSRVHEMVQNDPTRQGYKLWSREEYQREMNTALHAYGSRLTMEGVSPDPIQFVREYLDTRYVQSPAFQRTAQATLAQRQQAEQERVRKEAERAAAEREKQTLEQYVAGQKQNPHGRIPSAATTGQTLPAVGGPRTAAEARQFLRDRKLGRA